MPGIEMPRGEAQGRVAADAISVERDVSEGYGGVPLAAEWHSVDVADSDAVGEPESREGECRPMDFEDFSGDGFARGGHDPLRA